MPRTKQTQKTLHFVDSTEYSQATECRKDVTPKMNVTDIPSYFKSSAFKCAQCINALAQRKLKTPVKQINPKIMGVREYSKLSDRAGDLEEVRWIAEKQKEELETNVLFEPATNALIKQLRTTLHAEYKRLAKLYVVAEKELEIEDRKRAKVLPYCPQCGELKQQCGHK